MTYNTVKPGQVSEECETRQLVLFLLVKEYLNVFMAQIFVKQVAENEVTPTSFPGRFPFFKFKKGKSPGNDVEVTRNFKRQRLE